MNLSTAIANFLAYIKNVRSYSPLTCKTYKCSLDGFFLAMGDIDVSTLNKSNLAAYYSFLNARLGKSGEKLTSRSKNLNISTLRSFLNFLRKDNEAVLDPRKIEFAKTSSTTLSPTVLNENELQSLLSCPPTSSLAGKRDKAILELFYSTGMRVSELCNLKRSQAEEKSELEIVGKGNKTRLVFVSSAAKEAVDNYLKARVDNDPMLFIRHDAQVKFKGTIGSKMSTNALNALVKKYAKQAGIEKNVHPHTLRHQFATDLLKGKADIASISTLLGHTSIATTQIYLHLSQDDLRATFKK